METNEAVNTLSALAHETRLGIYRYLVEAGPEGQTAGAIGDRFDLPGATLSFHLSHLKRAGLVQVIRNGRQLIYSASYPMLNQLMSYLTENCCSGSSCQP